MDLIQCFNCSVNIGPRSSSKWKYDFLEMCLTSKCFREEMLGIETLDWEHIENNYIKDNSDYESQKAGSLWIIKNLFEWVGDICICICRDLLRPKPRVLPRTDFGDPNTKLMVPSFMWFQWMCFIIWIWSKNQLLLMKIMFIVNI